MKNVLVLAVVAVVLSACRKSPEEGPPESKPASSSDAGDAAPALPGLEKQAAQRPEGALRAEDVFAAFERAGQPVGETSQYPADAAGARFCSSGTVGRIFTVVCEYASEDEARAGAARLRKAQASKPNAEVVEHKQDVLSMTSVGKPPRELGGDKLVALFQAL